MRKTKQALFLSALSLLVCISMLIGTTFAWFTDSVSSVNNIIKSGNLDIEVSYSLDGTTFTPVGADPIFPETDLWEPGFTRVVALSVKNVGSLAAKLDVATNIASEVKGINVFDEEFKLSDYLKVYAGDTFVSTRDLTGMTESAFGVSLFTDMGILPGEEKVYVLGITMPTTVGNEANHKTGAGNQPSITFGLTVNATQLMHEYDSFGNDYDKDATYDEVEIDNSVGISTEEDLKTVFASGGSIKLTDDIILTAPLTTTPGTEVVLNLNGKNITNTIDIDTQATYGMIWVSANSTLTIRDSGEGTVQGIVFNEGTLNIEGGSFAYDQLGVVGTAPDSYGNIPELNITGGTISYTGDPYMGAPIIAYDRNGRLANVNISGDVAVRSPMLCIIGQANWSVKGGTFSEDPTPYLASGYVATENGGIWTVTAE